MAIQILIPEDLVISILDDKGDELNPKLKKQGKGIIENVIKRGWNTCNGDGYIHIEHSAPKYIKPLPKPSKNTYSKPNNIPLTIEEFVGIMENYICEYGEGEFMYPEVYNFNPTIKLAASAINNEIPEGLPNRMKTVVIDDTDPENIITEEQIKTWEEWVTSGGNYTLTLIDNFYYFTSVAGNKGYFLTGTQLLIIHNSTYSELVLGIPNAE